MPEQTNQSECRILRPQEVSLGRAEGGRGRGGAAAGTVITEVSAHNGPPEVCCANYNGLCGASGRIRGRFGLEGELWPC